MCPENENEYWRGKGFAFFQNTACEFFPCHKTDKPEDFNCLFCYCPLYVLGRDCGGNFSYTENGIKDCSACMAPHQRNNYGYITGRFQDIVKKMQSEEK